MDKPDGIIRERQLELQGLQVELSDALTGIESPDYERAARIQPIIFSLEAEIKRLEKLRQVMSPPQSSQFYLSGLLTDDKVTTLELWTQIRDHWGETTFRLLEIRSWIDKSS